MSERNGRRRSAVGRVDRTLTLFREWGRIGSAGRLVARGFTSEREVALAMAEHLKAKLSNGYEPV